MNILTKIVKDRKKYVKFEIKSAHKYLPKQRQVPLVDFFRINPPFIIGEYKNASPSQGDFKIKGGFRTRPYEKVVAEYYKAGIKRFSVLTEQNHFKGNLKHLFELKNKYPKCAFLRKDFLYSKGDIDLAYRAGADAVLLIAGILTKRTLITMIKHADKIGIQTLCEVHDKKELDKVLSLSVMPTAIGVNCRDLKTFKVDLRVPLRLRKYIPAGVVTVFESGIKDDYDARIASNAGFDCILIGQGIIESKQRMQLIKKILRSMREARTQGSNFFTKLYSIDKDRYIKVCGITNLKDAKKAKEFGADCIGFILADSKRKISIATIKKLKSINLLKVAVVVDPNMKQVRDLKELLMKGFIDAVQLHGKESVEMMKSFKGNAYKVISIKEKSDIINNKYNPVVLYDTPKDLTASKGSKMPKDILNEFTCSWVAGGIDLSNVRAILKKITPEFVDVCSGVEKVPGKKDLKKMEQFIKEVKDV